MIEFVEREEVKKPEYSFRVKLYSQSRFGYPEEIELKPMTLWDLKLLSQSSSTSQLYFRKLKEVVQNKITTPGVNVEDLTNQDFTHILIGLRLNSVGDDYEVTIPCPDCGGRFNRTYYLSRLPVKELPESAQPTKEILGYTAHFPRVKDYDKVWEIEDPADFILVMTMIALGIKEEDLDKYPIRLVREVSEWLKESDYGYDLTKEEECPHCGGRVEFQLPFLVDFWI